VMALCCVMTGEARARIFVGFGFPLFFPPVVVAPPAYYPPYYPPPAYAPPGNEFSYSPPGSQPQTLAPPRGYSQSGAYPQYSGDDGQSCRAGAYVCPLVEDTPPGGACSCPGNNGRRVRGRAD
jgi:hypothetical protein